MINQLINPVFWISLLAAILIHEFGHLIMAKLYNCKVDVFSIGFGKALFKIKIYDTIYQISLIPLGGYCKLKGEFQKNKSKYSFVNKPYKAKLFIVLAGCYMNIITGYFAIKVGEIFMNVNIIYFGLLSIVLGMGNLIPFPTLDGSYPFLILLEKPFGKTKAYIIMEKLCKIGFIVLIIVNILTIPLLFIWNK